MSDKEHQWQRRTIPEIGLALDFRSELAIESVELHGGRHVYQRLLGNDGFVFVRYGTHETLQEFIATPADMITSVSVVEDNPVPYYGKQARQLRLVLSRQGLRAYSFEPGGLVHSDIPEQRTIISVIGFTHNNVPILVGFRIPESYLDQFRPQLDAFLKSVTCL